MADLTSAAVVSCHRRVVELIAAFDMLESVCLTELPSGESKSYLDPSHWAHVVGELRAAHNAVIADPLVATLHDYDPFRRRRAVRVRWVQDTSYHTAAARYVDDAVSRMLIVDEAYLRSYFDAGPDEDPLNAPHLYDIAWDDTEQAAAAWAAICDASAADSAAHDLFQFSWGRQSLGLAWKKTGLRRVDWPSMDVMLRIELHDALDRTSGPALASAPLGPRRVTYQTSDRSVSLDGVVRATGLPFRQFEFARAIIDAFPEVISFARIRNRPGFAGAQNPTRLVESLPPAVVELIESVPRRGYRLRLPKNK